MKFYNFQDPSPFLFIYVHLLDLRRLILKEFISPNDNQSIKRKQSRDGYYILSGPSFRSVFVYSINSLILPGSPLTSAHLHRQIFCGFVLMKCLFIIIIPIFSTHFAVSLFLFAQLQNVVMTQIQFSSIIIIKKIGRSVHLLTHHPPTIASHFCLTPASLTVDVLPLRK